ncbi:DsbC family protein [Dissulfurirhabdus thermomarina]|uniref:DsbC family protein n=1 Tax=Dissulfurirhabdus thermomarina TaxID=1765737 RepID=A0A6N9TM70_DISTH|nr:DsbC family protein [Dissulfurirhabdus thermomarina]NDY42219.1 DsbC family protein [Dissulfurirhabdus thermomarina]NMX24116.1 DsbC family protein [Dissulfurirhabdus thermomarina]
MKLHRLAVLALAACCIAAPAAAETLCPQPAAVRDSLQKAFNRPMTLLSITAGPVEGLCELRVSLNGAKRVLYIDSAGRHLISGQIYDTATGENLTRTAVNDLNRFGPGEMKRLEELVGFRFGKAGAPALYLVTDPQCPYCKRAEAILKEMAAAGEVEVRVLFFPLSFHKGAKEQAVSILCDKKGLEGLEKGYRSDNQCPGGKQKVEATIGFLREKGITGTPTYIFLDGRFHAGVMQREALRSQLK